MGAELRKGRMRPPEGGPAVGESGQSILEFMIALPAVIVFTIMMVRVNTAIQVSIVSQKYARAQTLFLAYNSAYYPELRFRQTMIEDLSSNQLIVGVSGNLAPKDPAEKYRPGPIIHKITRPGGPQGNDSDPEADKRHRVRVRTTVALCTQLNVVKLGGEFKPYESKHLRDDISFPFCRSQFAPASGGNAQ